MNVRKMAMYTGSLIIIISLAILSVYVYVIKQQFPIQSSEPTSLQHFIENKTIEQTDNGMILTLSPYEFNQLLSYTLKDKDINSYTVTNIAYLDDQIFIEYTKGGKHYSYASSPSFITDEQQLFLKLDKYKMGTYYSRVLALITHSFIKPPDTQPFDVKSSNGLLSVKAIDINDDIKLTLHYNNNALIEKISTYHNGVDESKLKIYDQETYANMLAIFNKEQPSDDDLKLFIDYISQGEEALTDLSMIFKSDTIKVFLQDFKWLYAKRLNIDNVIARSQSELERSIQNYHMQFSKTLLQHLYQNPNYSTSNNSIYIDGSPITADTIAQSNELSLLYPTTLEANDDNISVRYELGESLVTKIILRKDKVE